MADALQLFRKLAQLKAFFRAMIVTVCSMKKFSGEPESPDPFFYAFDVLRVPSANQNAVTRGLDIFFSG